MAEPCSIKSTTGRWILVATLLATGTGFLMGTAVAVALPAIQSYFDVGITGIQWVINAQLLCLAALLLLGGALGDRYGRKRVFMLGMSVFAAGALLSWTAATTIGLLIFFQVIIGIGAALMIPQSLAIINICFVESERGQAIGLWAGLSGGIAALGPWVGGWVTENYGWQAIFLIPVILLVSTLIVTNKVVPESKNPEAQRLDWRGTLLILLGLFGIAYGLISGPATGWSSPLILISLIGGTTAIVSFFFVERRQAEPLVPLQIFREPLVLGANIVTFFVYFALNGIIIFLTLNMQQVQGLSPSAAGLALLPPIVIITFLSGPAGKLADRIGPRLQMILGPALVATGTTLFATTGVNADYFRHFLPGLILIGTGMALVIAPLTKSALHVKPEFSGVASGFNNTISRIAAMMAVVILGVIMLSVFTAQLGTAVADSALNPEQQAQILNQSDKLGGIVIPDTFDQAAYGAARNAISGSFVSAFRWAMGVSAALALIGAIVSARTIRNPKSENSQQQ